MGIAIAPYEQFGVSEYDYGDVQIRLIAYQAKYVSGEIHLTDHDEFRWVKRGKLLGYEWASADIPFVKKLSDE